MSGTVTQALRIAKLRIIKSLFDELIESYDRHNPAEAETADRIRALITKPLRSVEYKVTGVDYE